MTLVNKERIALKNKVYPINISTVATPEAKVFTKAPKVSSLLVDKFSKWKGSNVVAQKQDGFYGIKIKLQTGDFTTTTARQLADLVDEYAADDIRLTIGQGIVLKFVRAEHLEYGFTQLDALGLAEPGAESTADITA